MNNHNPLTWTIWGLMTFTILSILIFSIFFFLRRYRKQKKQVFTIKKISIFAFFLAFFIIQTVIFMPLLDLPIPFSIQNIAVITVGFIFGPIEGIVFGWVADSLSVLINGWSYLFLSSLLMPLVGLVAGIFGYLYWNNQNISKRNIIIIFQAIIISLFAVMLPIEYGFTLINDGTFDNSNGINLWIVLGATILSLTILEMIFFSLLYTKMESQSLYIFALILIINVVDRSITLVVRPFIQYFSGFEASYSIALYTRILSSTYIIPISTIFSYGLVEMSIYVMDL